MTRYVVLLRGVNVGGRRRLPMAELRELLLGLGHTEVVTYIQSGNAVLTAPGGQSAAQVGTGVADALRREFGFEVPTVVVTADQLAQIVADNPWPGEDDPKRLHVSFSSPGLGPPEEAAIAEAGRRAAAKGSADEARVVAGTLYLHTPDGLGRSELAVQLARLEKLATWPGVTTRNWATVRTLLGLVGEVR
ncbi:MAG TPA: DUF1697 domain-containing protein [Propionicimonas sp.]|jgi:uncharacterized protein (DUF1697 family)|nr:DUF1697 domain-containing protein [Propionicimonas sp.]